MQIILPITLLFLDATVFVRDDDCQAVISPLGVKPIDFDRAESVASMQTEIQRSREALQRCRSATTPMIGASP
jgi:hypothetical protein